MATWDDVRRVVAALPEVAERTSRGCLQWSVRDRLVAWERPLGRTDLAELGDAAPDGPLLGVRVRDEGAKRALVAAQPDVYLTTSHFDGYPAVLVQLDRVPLDELRELLVEAWLDRAPARLRTAYLSG